VRRFSGSRSSTNPGYRFPGAARWLAAACLGSLGPGPVGDKQRENRVSRAALILATSVVVPRFSPLLGGGVAVNRPLPTAQLVDAKSARSREPFTGGGGGGESASQLVIEKGFAVHHPPPEQLESLQRLICQVVPSIRPAVRSQVLFYMPVTMHHAYRLHNTGSGVPTAQRDPTGRWRGPSTALRRKARENEATSWESRATW
jgi:hypothetical protein